MKKKGVRAIARESGRWTAATKEELLIRIKRQEITGAELQEFMTKHAISQAELEEWARAFRIAGREGLKTTKVQLIARDEYRERGPGA